MIAVLCDYFKRRVEAPDKLCRCGAHQKKGGTGRRSVEQLPFSALQPLRSFPGIPRFARPRELVEAVRPSGQEDDIRALNRRTIEKRSCDVERSPIGKRPRPIQSHGTEVQHKVI